MALRRTGRESIGAVERRGLEDVSSWSKDDGMGTNKVGTEKGRIRLKWVSETVLGKEPIGNRNTEGGDPRVSRQSVGGGVPRQVSYLVGETSSETSSETRH